MSADKPKKLLYEELTYRIRGAMFAVHQALGPGHKQSLRSSPPEADAGLKEGVYHKALSKEFEIRNIPFISEKIVDVIYKSEKVGVYRPDFIVDDKVVIEIKAVPFLIKGAEVQMSYYLRGTQYQLGLLVNFGSKTLDIRRRIYSISANP